MSGTFNHWKVTNQRQFDHLGDYCTLSTSIAYDGGELQVNQRIFDSDGGYREGQANAALIVKCVNQHERAKAELLAALAVARNLRQYIDSAPPTSQTEAEINNAVFEMAVQFSKRVETLLTDMEG